ncbi:hypothetical protein BURC_03512 [Burkholderiaceae bacterium]|nr:hypothetical protein BURC_03512 [Burkholderiaceae bacterium]
MTIRTSRLALTASALAAMLAVAACGRDERIPLPAADAPPGATSSESTSSATPSSATMAGTPGSMVEQYPTGAIGTPAAAALAPFDQEFMTKAVEGGQFEVEVAKLAAEKASDAAVKAFAQMLVADHGAANDRLREIATSHNVALPASLPEEKKKELDRLAQLSGAEFDREFVKIAGLKDHRHDIDEFEKASAQAQNADVKNFAQSTLPTLKKHLEAAQKLPGAKG